MIIQRDLRETLIKLKARFTDRRRVRAKVSVSWRSYESIMKHSWGYHGRTMRSRKSVMEMSSKQCEDFTGESLTEAS